MGRKVEHHGQPTNPAIKQPTNDSVSQLDSVVVPSFVRSSVRPFAPSFFGPSDIRSLGFHVLSWHVARDFLFGALLLVGLVVGWVPHKSIGINECGHNDLGTFHDTIRTATALGEAAEEEEDGHAHNNN